jgi:branched-chain amino acid transport system substrate-binding protein
MKQKIAIIVGALIIIGFVIARYDSQNTSNNTVRIGVIIPLSENVAVLGENMKNGIELAAKESNTGIQFIFEDGGIEPKKALGAYQKLSSIDDVHLFIGPFGPDQIMSIAPVLKTDDIMLGISLCEDRFKSYPQIFCTYPSIDDQTKSAIPVIQSEHVKKLGFITEIGETGDVMEKSVLENQTVGGYSVPIKERIKLGDKDFRTIIAKIKAAHVDAIYAATLPDEGYILIKQSRELGFNGPIFAVFDAVEEKLNELGSVAEGVYLPGHISPNFAEAFTAEYKKTYKKNPDLYAALGHSAAVELISALRENDFDLNNLKSKLIGTNEKTAINGFTFRPDQTVSIPVESLLYKESKIQEIPNK